MSAKTFRKLQVVEMSTNFEKAVRIVEQPITKPEKDQVLVRNFYAGVNAVDASTAAGGEFAPSSTPYDMGFESVGVVEDVGENSGLKKGDAVLYTEHFASKGFSEYMLVNKHELRPIKEPKPEYLALGSVGLTAAIGLSEVGRIQAGDKVLITAAAGGTGQIAVQWAKAKECHVIGTCSLDEKGEYLKSIGCDFVINYKKQSIDEVLSKEYPDGVDVIWETIGGEWSAILLKHLALKGRMILLGTTGGYASTGGFLQMNVPTLTSDLILGSKQLLGFAYFHYSDKFPEYFQQLLKMFENGKINAKVDMGENSSDGPFKGLESIAKAVKYLHSGRNAGKVLVQIWP